MGVDAFAVAGASLATIIIAKFKCYVKKNGTCNYGCGFLDKNLVDDDEIEVKQFDMGDIKGIYVKPKGKHHLHHSEEHHIDEEETDTE